MKNTFFLVAFLLSTSFIFGQADSVKTRKFRHEIGVDPIAFLYLMKNPQSFDDFYDIDFDSKFLVAYRLKLKQGNIRFNIGGTFSSTEEVRSANSIPDFKEKYETYRVDFKVGWEFVKYIAPKWRLYYGLDFEIGQNSRKNEKWNFDGIYFLGNIKESNTKGIVPVFGMMFNVFKSISFSTEMGYSVKYVKSSEIDTFTPLNASSPPKANEEQPMTNNFYGRFVPPLTLKLNIAF